MGFKVLTAASMKMTSLLGIRAVYSHRSRSTFQVITASIIRQLSHLKRRQISARRHCVKSQKTVISSSAVCILPVWRGRSLKHIIMKYEVDCLPTESTEKCCYPPLSEVISRSDMGSYWRVTYSRFPITLFHPHRSGQSTKLTLNKSTWPTSCIQVHHPIVRVISQVTYRQL
jgi:hypothetical protein